VEGCLIVGVKRRPEIRQLVPVLPIARKTLEGYVQAAGRRVRNEQVGFFWPEVKENWEGSEKGGEL
jgi:hypothetical protein